MRRSISRYRSFIFGVCLTATVASMTANAARGQTFDATADFEAGWSSASNPNGVWSYGYSASATAPVTLYDTATTASINGGKEQFWIAPGIDEGYSPSVALNNGPAYNDGNVNFLANELVIAAGGGGQYSNVVFTAPEASLYSLVSSFRGDQTYVGTYVGIAVDGTPIFSSSVSSVGQVVTFNTLFALSAGDQVDFSVGPDFGLQNTGFSAVINVMPEPSSAVLLLAFGAPTLLARRRQLGNK